MTVSRWSPARGTTLPAGALLKAGGRESHSRSAWSHSWSLHGCRAPAGGQALRHKHTEAFRAHSVSHTCVSGHRRRSCGLTHVLLTPAAPPTRVGGAGCPRCVVAARKSFSCPRRTRPEKCVVLRTPGEGAACHTAGPGRCRENTVQRVPGRVCRSGEPASEREAVTWLATHCPPGSSGSAEHVGGTEFAAPHKGSPSTGKNGATDARYPTRWTGHPPGRAALHPVLYEQKGDPRQKGTQYSEQ